MQRLALCKQGVAKFSWMPRLIDEMCVCHYPQVMSRRDRIWFILILDVFGRVFNGNELRWMYRLLEFNGIKTIMFRGLFPNLPPEMILLFRSKKDEHRPNSFGRRSVRFFRIVRRQRYHKILCQNDHFHFIFHNNGEPLLRKKILREKNLSFSQ